MSDKMVKNGVSQGFIFHAIIPPGRQSGCIPHHTWSRQSLGSPVKSVNLPQIPPYQALMFHPLFMFVLNLTKSTHFGQGRGGCLPCSCTIHVLMIVLLVKLKNLDISAFQEAWTLIMEQQNSNQKCEGKKIVEFMKVFD